MSIRLKEEQERRLRTYVNEGRFPTVDAAAQYLLDMPFVADRAWRRRLGTALHRRG